jgi:hypothetical protein
MSYTKLVVVGVVGLAACAASFWTGHQFARGGGPTTAATTPGETPGIEAKPSDNAEETEEMTCSLTPKELNAQRKQLIPGLFQRAEKVEDLPNGLRFRFGHRPKLVAELAALIEKERVCCSFLSFRLVTEKGEGPITLEVTGPPGTADMLKKL